MADEKAPPVSRHFDALDNHVQSNFIPKGTSHEDLETAVNNYRTLQKEDLPAFHHKNIDLAREMYSTFHSELLKSESLSSKGDMHVNEKLADHVDTAKGGLLKAVKDYLIGHGLEKNVNDALSIIDKEDEKLEWAASIYDSITDANVQKGEGLSAIVRLLNDPGNDFTVGEYKTLLREETENKGVKRAREGIETAMYDKIFSHFQPATLATYLHKKLPSDVEIDKPLAFMNNVPQQFYQLHENIDKIDSKNLRQFGLRRKEKEPAESYK